MVDPKKTRAAELVTMGTAPYVKPSGMDGELFDLVVRALGAYEKPTQTVLRACAAQGVTSVAAVQSLDIDGLASPPFSLGMTHAVALVNAIDRAYASVGGSGPTPLRLVPPLPSGGADVVSFRRGDPALIRFGTVTVPDVGPASLVEMVRAAFGAGDVGRDFTAWDFYRGTFNGQLLPGRGLTYEVVGWFPGRPIGRDAVRDFFVSRGYEGHVAAFLAWIAESQPGGRHATFPSDNECWRAGPRQPLEVPACLIGGTRNVMTWPALDGFDETWVYIAFRLLTATVPLS